MAGIEKSKEMMMIQRLNELDRISELPDGLISEILSHLPLEDAVRTSVLSTRWRNLWLSVPRLRLDYREFPDLDAFVSIGDRFFSSDKVSCIDKLEATLVQNDSDDEEISYTTSWIDAAVKRKLQHLDVKCFLHHRWTSIRWMPRSLYTCDTLVSLNLFYMVLPNAEFVSLPRLKTMRLDFIWNPDDAIFERLVSSCPVLEELEVIDFLNDDAKDFQVLSRSLKKLSMQVAGGTVASKVVIDAPRLGFLKIDATLEDSFIITNMYSNVKLLLSLFPGFDEASLLSHRDRFCSFLSGISNVRDVTIFARSSKGRSYWKWLPTILESFPKLKSLSWERDAVFETMDQISFSSVPECLLSSLEFVDFKVPLSGPGF